MMRLLVPLLLLSSCQARTIDCGVVDVEVARTLIVDEYPDAVQVYDRMDIFCVDDTNTFQTCARAGYSRTESCTQGIGLGPHRGRMYADRNAREGLTALVMHEAQHWHLMLLNSDEGCPTHDAACGWSE